MTACSTPPADIAEGWVSDLTPRRPVRLELRWRANTIRLNGSGRGVVRFVPPGSLRVDLRAPLGRRGTALVLGDSIVWADPPDVVTDLVPSVRLLLAVVGLPRPPFNPSSVTATLQPTGRHWSYEFHDTVLTYYHGTSSEPPRLTGMMASNGRTVGTTFVTFDISTGYPSSGRIMLPDRDIVTVEYTAIDTVWIPAGSEWFEIPVASGAGNSRY